MERELWAILHTLERAKIMLSPGILLYTDNQGIISIGRSDRVTNLRLTKYLDLLNGFRLEWKHTAGLKNHIADYLNRFGLDDQPMLDTTTWEKLAVNITVDPDSVNINATISDTRITNDLASEQNDNTTSQRDTITTNSNESTEPRSTGFTTTIPATDTHSPVDELTEYNFRNPKEVQWTDILEIKKIRTEHLSVPPSTKGLLTTLLFVMI